MGESFTDEQGFPEDLGAVRDELLEENARLTAAGDDDGLMEMLDEVANNPTSLRRYLEAKDRTSRLETETRE